jgi:hypothetical protein
MPNAYIGIDLCFAKKKRLPISICTWRVGRLHLWPLKSLPLKPPRGNGNAAVLDRNTVRAFTGAVAERKSQGFSCGGGGLYWGFTRASEDMFALEYRKSFWNRQTFTSLLNPTHDPLTLMW